MSTTFFAAPPLGSTFDSSPGRQVEYTFNSRVMVAAMVILFIVVLFVVSLHIYAKWFWHQGAPATRWSAANALNASWHRRRRRLELLVADESMAANTSTGLDPATVNLLPTFTYDGAMLKAEPSLECAVCLSEFQVHEKGRILPNCKHSFHIDCIDTWFQSHSTCPLCRTPITYAGHSSFHVPNVFQQNISPTAHQRHADDQNTAAAAGESADTHEPSFPLNIPGLELHLQDQEGLANTAAPRLHTLIPPASVSHARFLSYGEVLCKDDIAHANLPHMDASGSTSARALAMAQILRHHERAAIERSKSLSASRVLSEDERVCASQPQKSSSFRISLKRLMSRELSKGRSRVFPAGQVIAEFEQSTGTTHSPV